jgi:23S rRNA pseudouridine2605 synthase
VRKNEAPRKIGLARALSKLGYCSRSHAEELIRTGRVSLNGKIRRDPETPVPGKQNQIAVDGKLVTAQDKIYLMMNKPRGIVTTASDERDRSTVYTILNTRSTGRMPLPAENTPWVAPVGRLDKASEGLLLLTNDSAWGARIASPETHLDKTYHVQVGTVADEKFVRALLNGVQSNDGEMLRAKQARCLRAGQIRRMMESLGVEVLRLLRVAIGPLQLGNLAKGAHRSLTADEKRSLDRALRGNS